MRSLSKSKWLAYALSAGVALSPMRTGAEDIDIFIGASGGSSTNPNVLIILDNTSNWSTQAQQWPGGVEQGRSELLAIKSVLNILDDTINVGLMMFPDNGNGRPGGFIRSHIREMNTTNKTALQNLLQQIHDNFQEPIEKTSSSSDYSSPLFDAWKYFGGYTSPSGYVSGTAGTPTDATHFGPDVFNEQQLYTGRGDPAAYTNPTMRRYVSPIGAGTGCGKNYIIFIGNGFPNEDRANPNMQAMLAGVGGDTTELALPNFTTTSSTTTTALGTSTACYSNNPSGVAACNAANASFCGSGYNTCTCGSPTIATGCTGGNRKYTISGGVTTFTVTPTNTYSLPTGNAQNRTADEWTRFMYQGDASSEASQQNITTYTIDVFNAQQSADQTALMMSMARVGGGKYFPAKSQAAIELALKTAFAEIQSLNSTFASASLPINATNRQLNDNEVYIGMFRPDQQAKPRWYGNMKRYQLISSGGGGVELGDSAGIPAVNTLTGFVTGCATSYWTTDSSTYWVNVPENPPPISQCTTSAFDKFSDAPDGPLVEKGSVAEIMRKGNNPPYAGPGANTPTWTVNRTVWTLSGGGAATFDTANTLLASDLVNWVLGQDVDDQLSNANLTETRPSIHGDVVHSRPLPVNQGGTKGTTLYYGSNDGAFRAVKTSTGKELWAFHSPDRLSKLNRLRTNSPVVSYPGLPTGITPAPEPKDYFFDGSVGLFQHLDLANSIDLVWIYPSMRRGGRMVYAFDASDPATMSYQWRAGCPNLADDTGCTSGMTQMGQSWSTPAVAFVKGYNSGTDKLVMFGGGYDACEDTNSSAPTCTATKGNVVFVLDGTTGSLVRSFATERSVVADPALVDIDYDGKVDYGYFVDLGGTIYRLDFIDSPVTRTALASASWTFHTVAYTNGAGRKFHYAPAVLPTATKVYLALGSGDREKPLEVNYPYADPVQNRFYVYLDDLTQLPSAALTQAARAGDALITNLDDASTLNDFTLANSCGTPGVLPSGTKKGWFIDLAAGRGEQTVTSAVIVAGMVAFSTNRALPAVAGTCATPLGEARGYFMNLINSSGTICPPLGNCSCGGGRSSVFVGGGLPPSPVITTVRVDGVDRTVCIGCADRAGGPSVPIQAREIQPPLNLKRHPIYWFTSGDN